jgi:predicted nucleic acid-binding protein
MKFYVETSAVGFYFEDREPRRRDAVRSLFARISARETEAFTSLLTLKELRDAAPSLARRLEGVVTQLNIPVVEATGEAEALAEAYLVAGIIPRDHAPDALHAALAVLYRADIIASYNLKHLANYRRVLAINNLNRARGLPPVDIRPPDEIL